MSIWRDLIPRSVGRSESVFSSEAWPPVPQEARHKLDRAVAHSHPNQRPVQSRSRYPRWYLQYPNHLHRSPFLATIGPCALLPAEYLRYLSVQIDESMAMRAQRPIASTVEPQSPITRPKSCARNGVKRRFAPWRYTSTITRKSPTSCPHAEILQTLGRGRSST